VGSLELMKKELQQLLHVTLFFFPHNYPTFKIDDFVKSLNQTAKKKTPNSRRANPEE
jgi:hypothetical protein